MAERGIVVDHSTLHRWVIRLVPLLDKAFRRHKRPAGRRWRMDETYIKVRGKWKYLYRAVDTGGQTIDFLLTAKRDAAAARRFFHKAIRQHGEPEVVTIDKSGANTAALAELNAGREDDECIEVRQNKYLNNLVEQDHRNIKRRIKADDGIQIFSTGAGYSGGDRNHTHVTQRTASTSARGRIVPGRAVLPSGCIKN